MSDERRDCERIAILGELHGEVMVYQPLSVQEIGIDGATVETTFPLHVGSLHDLRLALDHLVVVLKGRVVHSRITDVDQETVVYRSGMEFVEPSAYVAGAIAEYVTALKARRAGV